MAAKQESIHEDQYMQTLREVYQERDRDSQNQTLVKCIGGLQQKKANNENMDDFETKLVEFYESEWDHAYLVCEILRKIGNKRRHDWSKDYVYVYTLAGKFCFKVENAEFGTKWLDEVNRHYKLEPHHPQHTQTGGVIRRLDVEETALDQLAREVYRHKGVIDQANMARYLPKFEGEEGPQNLKWFQEDVKKHEALVKSVYENFIEQENARKESKNWNRGHLGIGVLSLVLLGLGIMFASE